MMSSTQLTPITGLPQSRWAVLITISQISIENSFGFLFTTFSFSVMHDENYTSNQNLGFWWRHIFFAFVEANWFLHQKAISY
jgi:hypothetical protein